MKLVWRIDDFGFGALFLGCVMHHLPTQSSGLTGLRIIALYILINVAEALPIIYNFY